MMNAKIEIHDTCKYNPESQVVAEVDYKNIVKFEVKIIPAEEIEATYDMVDDYNEYLILTFADGDTATFRNSYVDMFRMR